MAETTVKGVSLFSKERSRNHDVFDLALTYEGIEIRRPGEAPRHLSWERVSEWEIEQRRGGVLLTLRGGGSVTPLVIPRWKVDDLDVVLRDVTSHSTEPGPVVDEIPVVEEPPTEREPVVEPEPVPAVAWDLAHELNLDLQLELEPDLPEVEPTIADVLVQSVEGAEDEDIEDVAISLIWPEDTPLEEFPDLAWPTATEETEEVVEILPETKAPPIVIVAAPPEAPVAPVVPVEPPELVAPPVSSAFPLEPIAAAEPARTPRSARRRRTRRVHPLKVLATVTLLLVLAGSVALVLAQSAGLIHLSWLGLPS